MGPNPGMIVLIAVVGLAGVLLLIVAALFMLREERAQKDRRGRDEAAAPVIPAPDQLAPESTPAAPVEQAAASAPPGEAPAEAEAPAVSPGVPVAPPLAPVEQAASAPPGEAPAEVEAPAAPASTAPAAAQPAMAEAAPAPVQAGPPAEALRVLREPGSGQLVVEVDGRRYQRFDEIRDQPVQQRVLAAVRDLHAFAGLALPGEARPGWTPPPPSMNPFKQMQVLREMAKNPPAAPLTITEQIDETLQAKLAGTALAERGIRVRSGPRGTALFVVDGTAYDSVDGVPDADVRAAIRAAIAEWEGRSG